MHMGSGSDAAPVGRPNEFGVTAEVPDVYTSLSGRTVNTYRFGGRAIVSPVRCLAV